MRRLGFTLLEITIVLLIIGLIAGAVVVGESILTTSKLRTVMAEADQLTKGAMLFQDKYYSLPGDLSTATVLWGTASGGCPWGARTLPQTCSGNGNGKIKDEADTREIFTAWQHLQNGQMIEGTYTGAYSGATTWRFVAGSSVPQSTWSEGAGWNILFVGMITGGANATYYDGQYGHILMLGDTGFDSTANGVLKPIEQSELDTKFDDGEPDSGIIRAVKATYASACITGTAYNFASTDTGCAPIFVTGF